MNGLVRALERAFTGAVMGRKQTGSDTELGHAIVESSADDSALASQQVDTRQALELLPRSPNPLGLPPEATRSLDSLQPTRASLSDQAWYNELIENRVPPLFAKARVRHRRDLPALLSEHPGQFVAYCGEVRIAIRTTATELVEMCMQRGLKDDEFLLEAIIPEDESVIDAAMWAHI